MNQRYPTINQRYDTAINCVQYFSLNRPIHFNIIKSTITVKSSYLYFKHPSKTESYTEFKLNRGPPNDKTHKFFRLI